MAKMTTEHRRYYAACTPVHRTAAVPRNPVARRHFRGPFIFPAKGAGTKPRFPVPDAYHAKLAIAMLRRIAGHYGTAEPYKSEARKVLAWVRRHYPDVYACERDVVEHVKREFRL